MDFSKKENEDIKINKKLKTTANKIKRNRKNSTKLKKETEEFKEIKELLDISDTESSATEEDSIIFNIETDSVLSCSIPVVPPGIELFKEDKLFSLFDEETLCLNDFLNENEKINWFGKNAEVPNEENFRNLIAHRIAETILPDNEECHSINLYVLHLLSVHKNNYFLAACSDFLKFRRFIINSADLFTIFINFGFDFDDLIDSNLKITRKFKFCMKKRKREMILPYYNVEMVSNIVLYYARLGLVKIEPDLKLLIKTLTKLTLDLKIRSSPIYCKISLLISILASQLAQIFDVNDILTYLHLNDEHLLNQVEVARTVLMPISSNLHQLLIIKTINFISNLNILKLPLKVTDLITILKGLRGNDLSPLQVYCILQLINASLPSVTATTKEAGDINNVLVSLEAGFVNVTDQVDLVRLKVEIAKMRNLVMNIVEKSNAFD